MIYLCTKFIWDIEWIGDLKMIISQEIIIFRKLDFADQQTDIILYEMHETDPGFQFYQNR